jgi:GTP-binding protein
MQFLGRHQVPFCILYTKSDKLKPGQLSKALEAYKSRILEDWEEMPPYIVTSSLQQSGRDEILAYIRQMNDTFARQAL